MFCFLIKINRKQNKGGAPDACVVIKGMKPSARINFPTKPQICAILSSSHKQEAEYGGDVAQTASDRLC